MDIKTLIEEVILDLGNNKTLTDVSSKIQIIVRLLGDEELRLWYNREFVTGYTDEELPNYRVSRAADIKASYLTFNCGGLLSVPDQSVPIANLGKERYNEIMTIEIKDNISSIIEFSRHPDQMAMSLSPYEKSLVQEILGHVQIQRAHKMIPPSIFQTIIDSVQGRIIDLFMDLNEKVFNGELDIKSSIAKEEIHQVITNNITAGIIQTGSGTIDFSHSTVAAHIDGSINENVKKKLCTLVDEIEKIAKNTNEEFDEVAQEIKDIRTELQSATPKVTFLRKSFKAILWGISVSCKAAIEELVKKALDLLNAK